MPPAYRLQRRLIVTAGMMFGCVMAYGLSCRLRPLFSAPMQAHLKLPLRTLDNLT